ncbi:hypothetical protein LTS07_009042 [Exophiala sideris]|nr:hypothetical protein LTS07_009042 [Exophiala sideris]
MDLHASQIRGFFNIPVDKAAAIADKLKVGLALILKERKVANQVSRMILVGSVVGQIAVIVDDIADTCGTLALAAKVCTDDGAEQCLAMVTHGFLSGEAVKVIEESLLSQVIVANTLPLPEAAQACSKITSMDISHTLAEAVRRTHTGESSEIQVTIYFIGTPDDMRANFLSVIGVVILSSITTQAAPIQPNRQATGLDVFETSPLPDTNEVGSRIMFVGFLEDPVFLPDPAVRTWSSLSTGIEEARYTITVPFTKAEVNCKDSWLFSWLCTHSPGRQEIK